MRQMANRLLTSIRHTATMIWKTTLSRASRVKTLAVAASLALTACAGGPSDPYQAAQQALETGDCKRAQLLLGELLSENPANAEARLLAGEVALRMGNTDRAISEFKELRDLPQQRQTGNDRLAEAFLASGNWRMARETLEESAINTPLAHSVAIGIAMAEGRGERVLELLKQGLAKFPADADLQALDAYIALQSGDVSGAKAKLASALSANPNLVDSLLLQGRIALIENDSDLAKTAFDKVLSREPNNVTAILAQAAIARDAGDVQGAKDWLARANAASQGNPVAVYFAAQMAFEAGDTDRAFELVQAFGNNDGLFPALTRLQGLISARRGQTNEAIVHLNRYLSSGGDDALAHFVLAEALASNGETQASWKAISPLLDRATIDPRALQLGAAIAAQLGRPEAKSLAARARKANGGSTLANAMKRAGQAIGNKDWKQADAIYSQLLEAGHTDQVPLLNNAAQAKLALGDTKRALALARKAHGKATNNPIVLDTLGWTIYKSGGPARQAEQYIAQAAKLRPDDQKIAENLRIVRAAANQG